MTSTHETTTQNNKRIIERYLDEGWNQGNWSVAEEIVHPNVVFHDQVRRGDLPPGREGLRVVMQNIRTGMPDFIMKVEKLIAEDDLVVILWSATGTHAGPFNGYPATGRSATLHAISIVRLEDGRIVEGWQEADQLGMGQQIGMVPSGGIPPLMAKVMSWRARWQDRRGGR